MNPPFPPAARPHRPRKDGIPVSNPGDADPLPSGARLLDPGTSLSVAGVPARVTGYLADRLLVSALRDLDEVLAQLDPLAERLGWQLTVDEKGPRTRLSESEQSRARRARRLP